jgi:hypothetical protein
VAERLGNEKLTTLTNLNFDSRTRRNVQWFSCVPHFLPPSLATWSGFSGRKIPAVNYLVVIFVAFSLRPTQYYALNGHSGSFLTEFAAMLADGLERR